MVLGFRLEVDGRPTQRLLRRLDAAIELSRRMPEAKVLVSGGAVGGTGVSEASVMARRLIRCGIEPARLLEERHSRDTLENVEFAAQFAVDEGVKSVVVVSEEPHLTRAAALLELSGWFESSHPFSGSSGRPFTPVDLAATYRDALRLRGFRLHSERTKEMEDRMTDRRTIGDG
ncbi:YdcF family protein [Microbacterium sp. 179-I 3D3 NHS]|uniref:YdcF family protein n=1 Tax=unclassified Microbacterium TaxID=2609290 RepID=UPI0039A26C3B